jgi:hypothetical protein
MKRGGESKKEHAHRITKGSEQSAYLPYRNVAEHGVDLVVAERVEVRRGEGAVGSHDASKHGVDGLERIVAACKRRGRQIRKPATVCKPGFSFYRRLF